jgi:hypothetical protein
MIIKGVAFWASLSQVNSMSGKYQMDIGRLDADSIKALIAAGVTIRTDMKTNEGEPGWKGQFITAKSETAVKVVDARGSPLPDKIGIGNGSLVNVAVRPYEWLFKGKAGISAGLQKVQVIKLVAYQPEDDFEVIEDGFTFGAGTDRDVDFSDLEVDS